jgi:hypothetical protein
MEIRRGVDVPGPGIRSWTHDMQMILPVARETGGLGPRRIT